jgi:prevent-host-death family protein
MTITISRTDLARKTREIVEQVRQGQPVVVESYGQEQIVLLDALDYKLLRALGHYAAVRTGLSDTATENGVSQAVNAYLEQRISLSKTAEQLNLSRFDLMARFERLGIPLRLGPATIDEARKEIESARREGKSNT